MKGLLLALVLLVLTFSKRMDSGHKLLLTYPSSYYIYKHNGAQEDTPKHDWWTSTSYVTPSYFYKHNNAQEESPKHDLIYTYPTKYYLYKHNGASEDKPKHNWWSSTSTSTIYPLVYKHNADETKEE
jgi:hypothetical protein